jgi:hypothetical protein
LEISLSTVIPDLISPPPFLAYLIDSSDGQHKEPQQQCREQQRCQPATNPGAGFDDVSSNASRHAADSGQHAECSTPSVTTTAEG